MKLRYYLYIRQDVTTRWNSTFLMFERFLALKPALLEMQAQEKYRSHHRVLSKIKERDWVLIANVVTVLQVIFSNLQLKLNDPYQVFYEVTLQLSHASACLSEACLNTLLSHFQ